MKFGTFPRGGALASLVVAAALVMSGCSGSDAGTSSPAAASGIPHKTIGVWQSQGDGDGEKQTLATDKQAAINVVAQDIADYLEEQQVFHAASA